MNRKENDKLNIREYFLGNIAYEQEQIEERIMIDDEFFEDFLVSEEELIQNYVDEELSATEKQKFEEHFLISEERLEKVRFARDFRRYIDKKETAKKPADPSKQDNESKSESFLTKLFTNLSFPKAIPAFGVILITVAAVWFAFFYSSEKSLTSLEQEFAKLNAGDLSNPEKYKKSLSLISGTSRSSSEIDKTSKENSGDRILFRLALPSPFDTEKNFKIELLKDQKVIFTQNEIRSYNNEAGKELRLLIPAKVIESGKYQIRAQDPEKNKSRLSYTFLVE